VHGSPGRSGIQHDRPADLPQYFRDHRVAHHLQLAGDQSRSSDPADRIPLDPLDLSQRAELRRHWGRQLMESPTPKSGTSGLLSLYRNGVRHAWFKIEDRAVTRRSTLITIMDDKEDYRALL